MTGEAGEAGETHCLLTDWASNYNVMRSICDLCPPVRLRALVGLSGALARRDVCPSVRLRALIGLSGALARLWFFERYINKVIARKTAISKSPSSHPSPSAYLFTRKSDGANFV